MTLEKSLEDEREFVHLKVRRSRINLLIIASLFLFGLVFLDSLVVGGSMCSALPVFVSLFEGMNLTLPLPTKIMIAATKFFRSPAGIAFLLMVMGVIFLLLIGFVLIVFKTVKKDFVQAVTVVTVVTTVFMIIASIAHMGIVGAVFLPLFNLIGQLQ